MHVICGPPEADRNYLNEVVNGGFVQFYQATYNYDDSAMRDYLARTDQPIQYTYLPEKKEESQEDKNRYQINYGLDVFIG